MTASSREAVPRRTRRGGGSTGKTAVHEAAPCSRRPLTHFSCFSRCHAANLNGKYYRRGAYTAKLDNGVVWGTWRGLWYSLRHTAMKVRPLLFLDSVGSGAGEI